MNTVEDLYERYFANNSVADQAELFSSKEEVMDYIVDVQARQYPGDDDSNLPQVASDLWDYLQKNAE